ncbi:MAG: CPBP family intramembrane metalloprotease [Candidatus Lokiarchaeota archaeon]|nr:CPBP family intramembrane metalloprotease [Candidatus Lokiarchaeota archaeon]
MSEEKETPIKHCVHCGAKVEEGKVYCPNCGKIIMEPSKKPVSSSKGNSTGRKGDLARKCPGCGSLITSLVLEQCPICGAQLEPIPESQKPHKVKPGFIFREDKLEAERRFVLSKDTWNLKEGINIFTNSLLIYITSQLLLLVVIWYLSSDSSLTSSSSELSIELILISQIPGILMGLFPMYYIKTRNHNIQKLGLNSNKKYLISALIIGVLGGILLIFFNTIATFLNNLLYDIGLDFFDIRSYLEEESRVIREGGFWTYLLLVELVLAAISTEIVFRGVLHNTIVERLGKETLNGRISAIIIVAVLYASIYLFFAFPIGIYFFIPNFIFFLILGILYEMNGNLYNSIIASIFYNVSMILIILLI